MTRENSKQINKQFSLLISNLKFKLSNLGILNQILILLCIIGIISLFMPWVKDNENMLSWNSFHPISGNIGYIMSIMYLILLFLIIFTNSKEKLKLYIDLNFKNHFIIIFSGIASICFGIIMVSFIDGLSAIGQNIMHGSGIILSMTIGVLIFIGGLFMRSNYKKMNSEIILEHLNQTREKAKEKDNMVLPI